MTLALTVVGSALKLVILWFLRKLYRRKMFRWIAVIVREFDFQKAASKAFYPSLLELVICSLMAL
jgi:hypothetical protein